MSHTVTFSLFKFDDLSSRFWAFKMMRQSHGIIRAGSVQPAFYKLLGTGGGTGFDWYPDFSTYAFLATWQNREEAMRFFWFNKWYEQYFSKASGHFRAWLTPIKSHGKWSGTNPFSSADIEHSGPIAVLTRATIKWKYLPYFWSKVPKVSIAHNDSIGLIYSKGIGEYPLKQQATFSMWKDPESMKRFSYEGDHHKKVVQLTRKLDWYSEELFARFRIDHTEGNLSSMDSNKKRDVSKV